jgi:hypothetical protein
MKYRIEIDSELDQWRWQVIDGASGRMIFAGLEANEWTALRGAAVAVGHMANEMQPKEPPMMPVGEMIETMIRRMKEF